MLDMQIDLVTLQVCLLDQLFDEAERMWAVENEKKNENKCEACEPRKASFASKREGPKHTPGKHWPAHRRFWHRSPREWREGNVKAES